MGNKWDLTGQLKETYTALLHIRSANFFIHWNCFLESSMEETSHLLAACDDSLLDFTNLNSLANNYHSAIGAGGAGK